MVLTRQSPIEESPLAERQVPVPQPGEGQLLVKVELCGVCRTDLHVVEGDLPLHKEDIIPGHEVVGRIAKLGPGADRFSIGDLVGVAWLHRACGRCQYCLRNQENLCEDPRFTGYDVDGGYAEYAIADESFAYPLPGDVPRQVLAPLLCAGIIGYRALRRSEVKPGQRLGLYGFGASAHIVIQIARHWGCEVYVSSRDPRHQERARKMGASWVGGSDARPPAKLDAAILFAPAGDLVPDVLEDLDRGGSLAIAGIYLTEIPPLDYERHLFRERTLRSVTANTREDGRELLRLASEVPLTAHTQLFPLAEANTALRRLKHDEIDGAAVLQVAREA
jgi:propanol-preferring alcohol dehydrogenase